MLDLTDNLIVSMAPVHEHAQRLVGKCDILVEECVAMPRAERQRSR